MVGQAVDVSRVMMMMVVDASSIQVIQISAISGIYFTVCFVQNIINKFNFFFSLVTFFLPTVRFENIKRKPHVCLLQYFKNAIIILTF